MKVLAFDTSGPIGSVVLGAGGATLARRVLTAQQRHASSLIPAIEAVLAESGVARDAVDALVVGEGPGSFTGVRVAAATAKGLGRALGVPVFAASSLAAAAVAVEGPPVRFALFDARAERVFAACFGVGHAEVTELVPVHAGELRDVLAGDVPAGAVFVGDGAVKHRASIEGAGFEVGVATDDRTLADGLLDWHTRTDPAALDDLGRWEPEYARAPSAERLWKP